MKLYTYYIVFLFVFLLGCNKKDPQFSIEKGRVGILLKGTPTEKLDSIFRLDSLVKLTDEGNYTYVNKNRYVLYDSQGNHLLTMTPAKTKDSIEVVENIRIYDPRYSTDTGITINSTFKDIKDHYTVSRITNSINNILVFVNELDAYFVIDKKELPENLRYNINTNIQEVQIPDAAKIKYFMIGWQ